MKKYLSILIISLLTSAVFGQVVNDSRFQTASQAGIAYYPPNTGIIDLWIPLVINELISFGKHHIEFGIGYVINRTVYPAGRIHSIYGREASLSLRLNV